MALFTVEQSSSLCTDELVTLKVPILWSEGSQAWTRKPLKVMFSSVVRTVTTRTKPRLQGKQGGQCVGMFPSKKTTTHL